MLLGPAILRRRTLLPRASSVEMEVAVAVEAEVAEAYISH